jgi:transposase
MYPSDLTLEHWARLEPLLKEPRGDRRAGGRPRKYELRRVVDALPGLGGRRGAGQESPKRRGGGSVSESPANRALAVKRRIGLNISVSAMPCLRQVRLRFRIARDPRALKSARRNRPQLRYIPKQAVGFGHNAHFGRNRSLVRVTCITADHCLPRCRLIRVFEGEKYL